MTSGPDFNFVLGDLESISFLSNNPWTMNFGVWDLVDERTSVEAHKLYLYLQFFYISFPMFFCFTSYPFLGLVCLSQTVICWIDYLRQRRVTGPYPPSRTFGVWKTISRERVPHQIYNTVREKKSVQSQKSSSSKKVSTKVVHYFTCVTFL
jgi:hypothetical protein